MNNSFLKEVNKKRISIENTIFLFLRKVSFPIARISFFVVFFWFGVLKILELSPSGGVVHTLYDHTVSFLPWKVFIYLFGAYECVIGIIFLFPGKEKWAVYMLIPHILITFGPLLIIPKLVWITFGVPNLIGQYIIKNIVIIALAIFIAAFVSETKDEEKVEQNSKLSHNLKDREVA